MLKFKFSATEKGKKISGISQIDFSKTHQKDGDCCAESNYIVSKNVQSLDRIVT